MTAMPDIPSSLFQAETYWNNHDRPASVWIIGGTNISVLVSTNNDPAFCIIDGTSNSMGYMEQQNYVTKVEFEKLRRSEVGDFVGVMLALGICLILAIRLGNK